MAGLMNQRPQQNGAPAGNTMQPGGQVDSGEESNVSPEEQQQYDTFVSNGINLIFDENMQESMVQSLSGDGMPVEGLANTLVMVVSRLEDSAKENNIPLSPDVLYHGSIELMEHLAEFALEAGIHDFTEEEMESALLQALDLYREMKGDQLDPTSMEQDLAELEAADQAGQIEQVAPGITEYAQMRGQQ